MYHSDIKGDGPAVEDQTLPWYRRGRAAYILLALGGLLLIYLLMRWIGGGAQAVAPPPALVTVSNPITRSIIDWDDYVGRFEASQAVEVRPRISGQLVGVHFRDGDVVQRGQLLFTVDPRPFAASLAEAQARVASAQTALALARSELARANRLIADQAVSAEEVDSLKAQVQSASAQLAVAQAQVRARSLDVEFTRVRAPITGRVSDRRVDVGNLVAGDSATGATILTTINALDPIYFSFDGSEALYLKQRRQQQRSQSVEIRLQDEASYKWRGRVDFTDNTIDNGSGTIRGRAVIANPDYFLIPGMFGNMRLGAGASHPAMLVPDSAVITDQARKIVYVLAKDSTLTPRPVEIGALVDGLRVIRSGITATDKVVIEGVQFAQPGAKVNPRNGRIDPSPAAPATSTNAAVPVSSQASLAGGR